MLWHKKDRNNGGDHRKFKKARKGIKSEESRHRKKRSSFREEAHDNGKQREWQSPSHNSKDFAPPASDERAFSPPTPPDTDTGTEIWDSAQSSTESPSVRGGYHNYTIEVPEKMESREVLVPEEVEKDEFSFNRASTASPVSPTAASNPGIRNSATPIPDSGHDDEDFNFDFDDAETVEPPLPDRDVVPPNVLRRGIDFDVATKVQPSDRLKESLKRIKGN